ncbi:Very short patch repair protein [compost metagenome]
MTDFLSPAERSDRMSRIRGKDTQPELALRKVLHRLGLRYRLHGAGLPGKPDLVFPRYRTVVFVHGCFWHRHDGCSIASTPKSNTPFWLEKFEKNVARDARVATDLQDLGWTVLVVWECELTSAKKAQETGERLYEVIRSRGQGKVSAID